MPVTAGCRQPGLRVCLEANLLSVGSDILYVVSYHLLCERKSTCCLWPGRKKHSITSRKDKLRSRRCFVDRAAEVTSSPSGCPPVVPVACFTIKPQGSSSSLWLCAPGSGLRARRPRLSASCHYQWLRGKNRFPACRQHLGVLMSLLDV